MRLDKYLKVSRIIKRRTVAAEAADAGRVSLNGKIAKPASPVSVGDILEIRFGSHIGRYEVLDVRETVCKEEAGDLFRVLSEDEAMLEARS